MSEHKITLEWKRESESFSYESYNRDHVLVFEGGARVPASAAPAYRGNPAHINPEEALVAALSSCHMLTFLAVAAKKQFVVDRYSDHAVGFLEKKGKACHHARHSPPWGYVRRDDSSDSRADRHAA
jgi:organic hydroperoxide reductase OsmC/OhrA